MSDLPTLSSPVIVESSELTFDPTLDGLLERLEHHDPAEPAQAEVAATMAAFAHAHPDALERTCPEGHFTGSALVVEEGTERFVVLHHAKLDKWLQPGGHADGNGNCAGTALREATEETGIEGLRIVRPAVDLDIHEVRPPSEAPHLHLDIRYLVLAPAGSTLVGNHESHELRWVTVDDLDDLDVDEGLRRLAVNGLALARTLH